MSQKIRKIAFVCVWGGGCLPVHIIRQYGPLQNLILDTNNFSIAPVMILSRTVIIDVCPFFVIASNGELIYPKKQ